MPYRAGMFSTLTEIFCSFHDKIMWGDPQMVRSSPESLKDKVRKIVDFYSNGNHLIRKLIKILLLAAKNREILPKIDFTSIDVCLYCLYILN